MSAGTARLIFACLAALFLRVLCWLPAQRCFACCSLLCGCVLAFLATLFAKLATACHIRFSAAELLLMFLPIGIAAC